MVGITFFRSAARGLHLPARLTRESTKREGLQPRANERPRVGCCEELAGLVRRSARAIPDVSPLWQSTRYEYVKARERISVQLAQRFDFCIRRSRGQWPTSY